MYKHFPTIKTLAEKILAVYTDNERVTHKMLLDAIDVTEEQFYKDGKSAAAYVYYAGVVPELIVYKLFGTAEDLSAEDKATVKLMSDLVATALQYNYKFTVKDCKEIIADYIEACIANPELTSFSPFDIASQLLCRGLNPAAFKHMNVDLAHFFRNIQTYLNELDYTDVSWRTPVCDMANGLVTPDVGITCSAYDKFLDGVTLDIKQVIQFFTSCYDGKYTMLMPMATTPLYTHASPLPYGDIIKEALRTDINVPTITPRLKRVVRMVIQYNVLKPYEIVDEELLEHTTKRICKLCLNNRKAMCYADDIAENLALRLTDINTAYDMARFRNSEKAYQTKKEFVIAYLDNAIRTAPKLDFVSDVTDREVRSGVTGLNRSAVLWKAFNIKAKK